MTTVKTVATTPPPPAYQPKTIQITLEQQLKSTRFVRCVIQQQSVISC